MLGAYVCAGLIALMRLHGVGPINTVVVIVTLFGVFAIVGLIGVSIERIAYKPLRNATRLAPLTAGALGLSLATPGGGAG